MELIHKVKINSRNQLKRLNHSQPLISLLTSDVCDYSNFNIILNFNFKMMDFSSIEALKDLVGLDKDDDDGHIFGSAINPGTLGGK